MRKQMILLTLLLLSIAVQAQRYPERKWVRAGNAHYEAGKYTDAEVDYLRALDRDSSSYEALNNLSNTLYKQERYNEAAQLSGRLAQDTTRIKESAQARYNEGNALFKQRKLKEALEAYKQALRINPKDEQAKFNLAYTQKLLQQDEDKNKNDQNKDQDKQDQNKDKQDPNQDKQDPQGQPDKPDPQQSQPQQGGMQQSEAERMLDAIQSNEDNTKKKVDAQKVKSVGRSGKNW